MATAAPPPSKRRRQDQHDKAISETSATKGNTPLVVFAHGAGAPSTSEWMLRWKKKIEEELNAIVVTFDYPYISGGKRKAPPKAEKLVDHHLDVVKDAVSKHPGHPLVLVGKSMGSRVSCMVTTKEDIPVAAIVCLGYPLKGINGAIRDETLLQLETPTMFVQGSKDGLCPLDKLENTRKKMKCPSVLHVIDGGDHSFKIGKKQQQSTGVGQDEAEQGAMKAMAEFVSKSIPEEEGRV
ncbi:KAT8 regulatory NSL complex subunit 3-like [Zingiber officinale]|uniref:KAT8 regulatory NSL complex subunit 3-like n=1 Tax=Zingiber officinale TaxID=94328 RepID=UPI001C4BE4FF|nr:KAT8 regulatory NSL complex subunit 3-like [Zingiber officinale]XP_042451040.1 KAT8 regulatory NSL complex subunit 3-like [Zingiber officinale]